MLFRSNLKSIVQSAQSALEFSQEVDRILAIADLLFAQAMPLAEQRIKEYRNTPANHRLRGDNSRIAFLITWIDHGKYSTDLQSGDRIVGWCGSMSHGGITTLGFVRHIDRRVKQYRGAKRIKGEGTPSWKLCRDELSNWYHRQRSNSTPDRNSIALSYIYRIKLWNGETGGLANSQIGRAHV